MTEETLLVVPIDDADLKSRLIPGILTDIFLMSCPNVIFLFTACRETLQNAMYVRKVEELIELRPHVPPPEQNEIDVEVRTQTQSLLDKILPQHLSVNIPTLTLEERLLFKPWKTRKKEDNDEYPPFYKLLEKFEIAHPHQLRLIDFFDFSENFGAVELNRPKNEHDWVEFIKERVDFPLLNCWFDEKTYEYAEKLCKEGDPNKEIGLKLKKYLKECKKEEKEGKACRNCREFAHSLLAYEPDSGKEKKASKGKEEKLRPSSYTVMLPKSLSRY